MVVQRGETNAGRSLDESERNPREKAVKRNRRIPRRFPSILSVLEWSGDSIKSH